MRAARSSRAAPLNNSAQPNVQGKQNHSPMNITQHRPCWEDGPATTLVLLDGFAVDRLVAAQSPADPRAANGRASATPSKKVLTLFMVSLRSRIAPPCAARGF